MYKKIKNKIRGQFIKIYRKKSHSEVIEEIITKKLNLPENPVFVEIGCGVTTIKLAELAKKYNAKAYSLDIDAGKVQSLKSSYKVIKDNIEFLVGNSLEKLQEIVNEHKRVDFVFLDSSASALQTFKEFMVLEDYLSEKAGILIDNAALPCSIFTITAVRKGKIIVPYLLASCKWDVKAQPRDGDSMISAFYWKNGDLAHPGYVR